MLESLLQVGREISGPRMSRRFRENVRASGPVLYATTSWLWNSGGIAARRHDWSHRHRASGREATA